MDAMDPMGAVLTAWQQGDASAELIVRREDGLEVALPAAHFFREPVDFTGIERAALQRCRGHVLDAGAGSGLHSLALQEQGVRVTAIEVSAAAVAVMKQRGVEDVHCADLFEYRGGPFDTILMMGHGLGVAQDLAGLDRLLARLPTLLAPGGQVLVDSLDVSATDDPVHLAYHQLCRDAGRYIGETRVQIEFRGEAGPYWGWLHADAATLREHAAAAGWQCETVVQEDNGNHLARLSRAVAARGG